MFIKKGISLKVPPLSKLDQNDKKSVIIETLFRRKENISPNTCRSQGSDRSNNSIGKTFEKTGLKKQQPPFQAHSKINCECNICQNKRNDSKEFFFSKKSSSYYYFLYLSAPEIMLDSFFGEEDEKFESYDKVRSSALEMEKSTVLRTFSQISALRSPPFSGPDHELLDKDFLFVLKRILPSKNSLYSLRILIPDTVVFFNGEAKYMVYNGQDDFLKCIRQKEKLNLNEIKTFFLERKSKKDSQLLAIQEAILMSLLAGPRKSVAISPRSKKSNLRMSLLSEDLNSEIVEGLDLKKVQETIRIKRFNDSSNSASKEFAFVRYKDNNVRVLSEMDFLNLMTRRRIEKSLNDVLYLQMFLKPKKGKDALVRVKYIYEREKEKDLFKRSLSDICFLSNMHSPNEDRPMNIMDQETLQFEIDLKKSDLNDYCYYMTYKIVHYIEAFYGVKISKFIAEYLQDDFNNFWLMNCCHIKYKETAALPEADYILKKVNLIDAEQKNQLVKDLEAFYNKAPKSRKKKIDKNYQRFMANYEQTKEQLGIDLNAKTPEDSFSDNVFKNLNPNNPQTLTNILKNSHKTHLKRYVLQNFPENLLKFQKEYKDFEENETRKIKGEKKLIRPLSHNIRANSHDVTKSTNNTTFNKTNNYKFGINYENKNKKQEKFLEICNNGFAMPKNIDYNNFLGEVSSKNLNLLTNEREHNEGLGGIKLKNNFKMKKCKEKKQNFQINNNFFKDTKEIETNGINMTKYSLKNLPYTLPYMLYHNKK